MRHYSSTEIKAEQAKTKHPANATALTPVQINEELYHSISPNGKFLDRPFHYIQNALDKGAQLLVSVWSMAEEAFMAPAEEEVKGVVKMPSTMATTTIPQVAIWAGVEANLSPSNLTTH